MANSYDELVVNNAARNAAISEFVVKIALQRAGPGIIFTRYRRHARTLAECLRRVGVEAPVVTAEVPRPQRELLAKGMREHGTPRVAVSTSVWSTGLDIPGLAWVLLTGAGSAPVGLLQASGRATRSAEGKHGFTVYDVADVFGGATLSVQAASRGEHHQAAGFVVEDPVQLLELVIEDASRHRGRKGKSEQPGFIGVLTPEEERVHLGEVNRALDYALAVLHAPDRAPPPTLVAKVFPYLWYGFFIFFAISQLVYR